MPDVIEQLRSYGEAVEATVPPADVREPRNRRPLLLAAAALVLVACTAAGVWALRSNDGADDDGPVVDTTEVPPVEAGWQTLDPGPLEPREGAAVVWTGEELVVWGGAASETTGEQYADGATFDPGSGEWRRMAAAPLGPGRSVGVWTGEEVLVWSISSRFDEGFNTGTGGWQGAAWDPTSRTWRTAGPCPARSDDERCLQSSPLRSEGFQPTSPVWTGSEMLDAGLGAAYNPAGDSWRDLPPLPVGGEVADSVWTGDDLLVLMANHSEPGRSPFEAVALSYSPTEDVWTTLPPTGVGETAVDLAWDGERAIALDYEMQAASYRPGGDEWTPLPPLPLRFYECDPRVYGVGGTILAQHCSGYAVLTDDDRWAIAPPPARPIGGIASAGGALYSWWFTDAYGPPPRAAFQSFRPPNPVEDDLALGRTIPIGTVLLDLPDGTRLTDTAWSEEAGGLVTHIGFELALGDGQSCTITSTYAGIQSEVRIRNDASRVDAEISHIRLEQVDIGRDRALVAQWPAGATDDQAHILVEESTSDVLDIACPDLPTANALLERIHR